jgi:hypothetical protein
VAGLGVIVRVLSSSVVAVGGRRGAFLGPDGVSSKAQESLSLVAYKRRQSRALDPKNLEKKTAEPMKLGKDSKFLKPPSGDYPRFFMDFSPRSDLSERLGYLLDNELWNHRPPFVKGPSLVCQYIGLCHHSWTCLL